MPGSESNASTGNPSLASFTCSKNTAQVAKVVAQCDIATNLNENKNKPPANNANLYKDRLHPFSGNGRQQDSPQLNRV